MKVMQLAASGLEGQGGYNYGVLEVASADEFEALTNWQDGSVGYVTGSEDIYVKSGTWAKVDKTALPGGRAVELDGINPFMLMAANHLFARRAEVAPELEADKHQYYIRDALPTTEDDNFEGMIVFVKAEGETSASLSVCTTPGEQEVDTLTVTKGAITKAGNITVTLNAEAVVVAVTKGDTPAGVASKIKAAVDAAVDGKTIAAWTVVQTAATLVFTKDVIGACAAPTAVDTGGTGCEFGTFTRTNQGVTAVWADMINPAT